VLSQFAVAGRVNELEGRLFAVGVVVFGAIAVGGGAGGGGELAKGRGWGLRGVCRCWSGVGELCGSVSLCCFVCDAPSDSPE
jgi:hypothetical protein